MLSALAMQMKNFSNLFGTIWDQANEWECTRYRFACQLCRLTHALANIEQFKVGPLKRTRTCPRPVSLSWKAVVSRSSVFLVRFLSSTWIPSSFCRAVSQIHFYQPSGAWLAKCKYWSMWLNLMEALWCWYNARQMNWILAIADLQRSRALT